MTIKKFSAALVAAAALGSGCAGLAVTALTAPVALAAPAYTTVDPSATYTLTITKFLGTPTGAPSDGTAMPVAGRDALNGVDFDIYTVQADGAPVDLTTNEGWAAATNLQGVQVSQANVASGTVTGKDGTVYQLARTTTVTTATSGRGEPGQAVYSTVGPRLVLVAENLSTSTAITNAATGDAVARSSVVPTQVSLVTLPMTNPDGTAWMNDVFVYPKNVPLTATKAVSDLLTVAGTSSNTQDPGGNPNLRSYTVTGRTVAPAAAGSTFTGQALGTYAIQDQLDPRLAFSTAPDGRTNAAHGLAGVTIRSTDGATVLDAADYQVVVDGTVVTGTVDQATGGNRVTMALTASGLDKLAAAMTADPATTVDWTFYARALSEGDHVIRNTGHVVPSLEYWQSVSGQQAFDPLTSNATAQPAAAGDQAAVTGVATNTVESRYGDVVVTKTDARSGALLPGATFDLFHTTSNQWAGGKPAPSATACDEVTQVDRQSNGWIHPERRVVTGLVTGADGTATVAGLQDSLFHDNAPVADGGDYVLYCLLETRAPVVGGTTYNLLAKPVPFVVTDVSTTTQVAVQNTPKNLGNTLPTTGGLGGTTAAGVAGLLGAATLGSYLYVSRRRKDAGA